MNIYQQIVIFPLNHHLYPQGWGNNQPETRVEAGDIQALRLSCGMDDFYNDIHCKDAQEHEIKTGDVLIDIGNRV